MAGPRVRTNIIDVYVFRRTVRRGPADIEFLQLHRAAGDSAAATWQPVMGHAREGESAACCAVRELAEETAYGIGAGLLGLWQLEAPNIYFSQAADWVMLSPCFAVEVSPDREPRLNGEHDGRRWVPRARTDREFMWSGQRQAIAGIVRDILEPGSAAEALLRIDPQRL